MRRGRQQNGLPVNHPSGDSENFDCLVGRPGKFVAVQVKCTIAELPNAKGYPCSVGTNNKRYQAGAFDFMAAYVIPEDAWYIIPANLILGLRYISLCTTNGGEAKYEQYREAWHLLREASGCEESNFSQSHGESDPQIPAGPATARMQGAMNFFRDYLEKGGR